MTTITRFPIHFMPPSALLPYYQNVKEHSKGNVQKIARLLKVFDFDQPIVVDANKVIIKGHGRYMAALMLGKKLVPVVIRPDLSEAQVKAARIADNRVFEMGETDDSLTRSEVLDFAKEGGLGASAIFDFMKPPAPKKPTNTVKTPSSEQEPPSFKGTMEVCPKCQYTFWEGSDEDFLC